MKKPPARSANSMLTFSGQWFDPLAPEQTTICIEDIAHALACMNRYGGHVHTPFSVAQHSILCAQVAPDHLKLDALMHDASEAYVCDVPRPLKRALPAYRAVEDQVEAAIRAKFGLPGRSHGPQVREIDNRMLVTEAKHFGLEWWSWFDAKPYPEVVIEPWDWKRAEQTFLLTFRTLLAAKV